MSHSEAPISITVKTAAGSLITVRAEHGEQLDELVSQALDAIVSAAQELEAGVRGTQPASSPAMTSVIANITDTLGGTTIPSQSYAQPAPSSIGGRNCPHGRMTAIQGMGKDGKPYKGYFCPAPKGAFDKCKNQYVTVQSPDWNTFVPEQIK